MLMLVLQLFLESAREEKTKASEATLLWNDSVSSRVQKSMCESEQRGYTPLKREYSVCWSVNKFHAKTKENQQHITLTSPAWLWLPTLSLFVCTEDINIEQQAKTI